MEEKRKIDPPYINLDDKTKASLGYLTVKRVMITLRIRDPIWKMFQVDRMKEAFQWFDREKLWGYFIDLKIKYKARHNMDERDATLYTATDFFVWFINYEPSQLSEIISYHLKKSMHPNDEQIKLINNIFSPTGFIYEGEQFISSSFEPSITLKINDFLSVKLKNISEELHTTWLSIREDIVSNNSDKATTISAKSRKVINELLRKLTPSLTFEKGEQDQIKKRLEKIFPEQKQSQILEKVSNLITALNQVQAKGNHSFINEDMAIFIFQLTGLVIFYILSNVQKTE